MKIKSRFTTRRLFVFFAVISVAIGLLCVQLATISARKAFIQTLKPYGWCVTQKDAPLTTWIDPTNYPVKPISAIRSFLGDEPYLMICIRDSAPQKLIDAKRLFPEAVIGHCTDEAYERACSNGNKLAEVNR